MGGKREEDTRQMLAPAAFSATAMSQVTADAALLQQKTLLLSGCTVLVLVMALGIVLVYLRSPRSRAKTMLVTAGVVVAVWVLCGYGLSFGPVLIPGFLGNPLGVFAAGETLVAGEAATLHGIAFAAFQAAVVILTVTIVWVVAAGRTRTAPWLAFVALWLVLVYAPLAYSDFNMADGWLFGGLEVNDQAGGLVVQVSAGAAALALLLVLGRAARPVGTPVRSTSTILGGVALVWIGAFGLNIGSEGAIDGLLGTICLNTLLAPLVAAIAWSLVEVLRHGRANLKGAAFGVLAGIVAITPACNILTPLWTVLLGFLAGAICAVVVSGRPRDGLGLGERIAVPGIHLVGGVLGTAYVGLFATGIGWKDTGQPDGLMDQAGAAFGVAIYSFVVAFVLAWALERTIGLRQGDTGLEPMEPVGAQLNA